MNDYSAKQQSDDSYNYTDSKFPKVTLHIQVPAGLDEPSQKRAHSLANQLSKEIFAKQSPLPPDVSLEISAEALRIDSNDKYAAEGDSKEWMAAQCRTILSKMSFSATSAADTKSAEASKESIAPSNTSGIYSDDIDDLMMQVGHIHGDLFIQATQLEAYNQIKMMQLSLNILEKQLASVQQLPKDPHTLKTINELTTLITRITNGLKTLDAPDIAGKVANIQKALKNLKPSEGILLPGGWTAIPQGHSMCYEMIKQKDNSFTMRIINTGVGNINHEKIDILELDAPGQQPKTITKFFPYLEYINITADRMLNGDFWRAALEIQTHAKVPSADPDANIHTEYNELDLYGKLFPSLGGTQVLPSKTNPDKFILSQSSGTCSWASMRAYMQTHMSPQAFARLEHQYKMESLTRLHQALDSPEKLASNEKGRLLLLKSSEHMANSLQENSEKHFITAAENKNARALLQRIQDNITKSITVLNEKLDKETPTIDFPPGNTGYFLSANKHYVPIDTTANTVNKQPCEVIFNKNWHPTPLTLSAELVKFQKLYSQNLEKYPENVSLCIRELLLKLPKSKDAFWKQLPSEQIDSCVETISQLCELLMRSNQQTLNNPDDHKETSFLVGIYKSQMIIHELIKRVPELQKLGAAEWNLNSFQLNESNLSHLFNQEVADTIQEIQCYADEENLLNYPDKGSAKNFLTPLINGCQADKNFSGLPTNDKQFVYRYYLDNKKKFEAILGQEFEKFIKESEEGSKLDIDLAKATFAMADLSGKFLPPAYNAMRRLNFQIKQFRYSYQLNENQTSIPCKIGRGIGELMLAQNNAVKLLKKDKTDYNEYAILSKFPNRSNPTNRNEIVKFCQENPKFKPIFEICELPHTIEKTVPYEIQIIKLLDYFKVHIDDLNIHDFQYFFKQVLFQKNDLKSLMLKNPELANRLAKFIQNSYSTLKERKNISGATYMIYLAKLVQETLSSLPDPSRNFTNTIKFLGGIDGKFQTNKESLLNLLKDCKTATEKSLVHQQLLYHYSFDLNQKIAPELLLPDILASMAFLRSFPVPSNLTNSHVQNQIDQLSLVDLPPYLELIKKDPQLLTKVAQKAFQFLGIQDIEWKNVTWQVNPYPIYEAIDSESMLIASVDLSNYTVLPGGEGLGPLPQNIINHPSVLKALPSMTNQIVKILQHNLYEFTDETGFKVRIKVLVDDSIAIQKEFFVKNMWFEFQPSFTVEPFTHSMVLPYERSYWACCGADQVLLCKHNSYTPTHTITPITSGESTYLQVNDLSPSPLRLLNPGDPLNQPYKGLENFEDTSYTHVWVNSETSIPSKIEMSRLKLNFNVVPVADAKMAHHAMCSEITGYRIADKQHIPFLGTFKNYLVLQNEKGELKVIIPRKKAVVTEKGGLTSQISLENDFPGNTDKSKFPPYYEYAINPKSGELEATKEGGNLFLSYILTGQRRYKEVQTYLREKSAKVKKYSDREVEILTWMKDLVPATADNDPRACIAFLTTSALFARNQIQGKNYPFLAWDIQVNYDRYLSNMHHMGDLQLSPEEELAILKILINANPRNPTLVHRFNLFSNDSKIQLEQTPKPPNYDEHLTPEELAERDKLTKKVLGDPSKNYQEIYVATKILLETSIELREQSIKVSEASPSTLITRPNLDPSIIETDATNAANGITFNIQRNYNAARATKKGDNVNAAMHFKVLYAFDPDPCNVFLAAVALEPEKFPPSWDELVKLYQATLKEKDELEALKTQQADDKQSNINTAGNSVVDESTPKHSQEKSTQLLTLFKQADQIYFAHFATPKTINEPDQKIESFQKAQVEAKAQSSSIQAPSKMSDALVVPNSFSAEKVSAKRIQLSQQVANKLFVASQMDIKESSTKANSDQLIKELSQKTASSNDPISPLALSEAARTHMIRDIQIYSAQPAKPSFQFKDKSLQAMLKTADDNLKLLSAERNESNKKTDKLQNQILGILNKSAFSETPSTEQLEVTSKYHTELLSGKKRNLTINDLSFSLLRNNAAELSIRNPHLSKDDIDALSLMLNSYLISMTEENMLKRQEGALLETVAFMKTMPDIPNAIDSPEFNERIDKAAKELSIQRAYDPHDPKINSLLFLIFEATTGLSLRPDQIDNITGLIKADNQIRQMIMGSGKSKILLPLLALTRADGQNLSLIIIPPQLFEDTVQDLLGSLGTAFGKSLRTLPFERDTEFTISKLKDIHDHLKEIIRNRECLMMTPKSVACLSLKLNEALDLFVTHPDTPELREKIEMLQKILNILKNQGKAIIDEADMILNPRLEVNYTAGKPIALNSERCGTVGIIYQQLLNPSFQKQIGFNPIEEFNLSADAYQKHIKPALLKNIIEDAEKDPESTFGKYLKTLSSVDKAMVVDYLEGLDSPAIEALIEKSPMRDTLALLKEEVNVLLPLTLSKQYSVHYGPSQKKTNGNQPISSLAIPYKGNNSPDESSQFQSPDILMNYTMLTLLRTGVSAAEIKRVILNLRNQASQEMALKGSTDPLSTAAYKEFQELCGKELSHIKFLSSDDSELEQIALRINNTRTTTPNTFLKYVTTHVFPQIKLHPRQMTSDAINLVSMFKSVNGFTGTPWNNITYHEAITGKNVITVDGTDGKTAMLLNNQVQAAKDGIRDVSTTVFPAIIADLVRKDDDAIIDTGALFAGHSHEKVALGILEVLQSRGTAKKGVIFYKNNKAMVLEQTDTPNNPRLVPLKACRLTPQELFTYYDQSHTTGADIPQHLMAKATLTIGKNVTERDLAQGAWRMRGLDKQQTVSLALSPEVAKLIGSQYGLKSPKEITFAQILNFVSKNQVEELAPQIMTSIKNKFNDMVLQPVKNKILNTIITKTGQKGIDNNIPPTLALEDPALKVINEVRHILVSEFNGTPYALYGKQEKPLPTLQVIEKMKNTALKKLESIPAESQLFESTNKKAFIENISNQMDALIKKTAPLLPTLSKGTVANEAIAQNEQETETETDLALQSQSNLNYESADTYLKSWWQKPGDIAKPLSSKEQDEGYLKTAPALLASATYTAQKFSKVQSDSVRVFNIGDLLKEHPSVSKFALLFGKGIDLTDNAYRTDKNQLEGQTQYTLYVREKSTGNMKLILLDPQQDVSFFWEALGRERQGQYPLRGNAEVDLCLCSLDGDVVQHSKGINPVNGGDAFIKDFQTKGIALRAQAKLLRGELYYTSEELTEIQKIIKEHGVKLVLEYFKESILPRSSPEKQRAFKTSQIYQFLSK